MSFGIALNVLALGYFKYTDFLIDNVNAIFHTKAPRMNIALPLAISFFTFQQIAYLVDCYKRLVKDYDFLSYALFVSFFPQLIAGPIVAHYEMMPQFIKKSNLVKNYRNIFHGIILFNIGLFKKVVIADTFARYATIGFDDLPSLTFWGGWFSSLSYTAQIYFDFSGYCDMAMGCALLFNIRLPVNFDSPYKTLNIQDFWRRWHITLSRFLRDYLYIPLGGSRKGELRTYVNIFLIFFIGGLWHGAAWTFVAWGCLHGLANMVYRLWKKTGCTLNKFAAWFITFNFINVTWVFFRAKSFAAAQKVLSAMFCLPSADGSAKPIWKLKGFLKPFHAKPKMFITLLIIIALCTVLPNAADISNRLLNVPDNRKRCLAFALAVLSLFLLAKMIVVPYSEFIYFNF